jgi:hypothetical protein
MTTKVKKTCVSISENTWNYLNRARGINETMEQVIIRMINIPQAPPVQPPQAPSNV